MSQDIVRYYAECLKKNGHEITPDHITVGGSVHLADSREQAIKEAAPYTLYFNRTLFSHGNMPDRRLQQQAGYTNRGKRISAAREPGANEPPAHLPQHDHRRY